MSLSIVFIFIIIFALILGIRSLWLETRRKEKKYIKDKVSLVLDIQNADKKILKILADNFNLGNCRKCDDIKSSIIEFNSIGTSVYVKCSTCSTKAWIKASDDFKDGNIITETLEQKTNYLDNFYNSYSLYPLFEDDFDSYEDLTDYCTRPHDVDIHVEEQENQENSRKISKSVQDRVWRRDKGKCVECGSKNKLEFDHIVPFSKGGSNTYRNIQLLCEHCNRSKGANI